MTSREKFCCAMSILIMLLYTAVPECQSNLEESAPIKMAQDCCECAPGYYKDESDKTCNIFVIVRARSQQS